MDAPRPRSRAVALDPPSASVALARALPSGRSLLIGFALLAAAVGGYVAARSTSVFAVRAFEVQGAPPRVAARVERALTPLTGRSLLAVDAAAVDRTLAGLPDVEAVGVDRHYPRTLRVRVMAERPVAVLRRGSEAWLVSERGRVLQALPGARPKLPRIWVASLADPKDGALLSMEGAIRPARALGAILVADRRFLRRIREARAVDDTVVLILLSGTELRLGALSDAGLKVAVAKRVLEALRPAVPTYVDVSVPGRPVAVANSQVSS